MAQKEAVNRLLSLGEKQTLSNQMWNCQVGKKPLQEAKKERIAWRRKQHGVQRQSVENKEEENEGEYVDYLNEESTEVDRIITNRINHQFMSSSNCTNLKRIKLRPFNSNLTFTNMASTQPIFQLSPHRKQPSFNNNKSELIRQLLNKMETGRQRFLEVQEVKEQHKNGMEQQRQKSAEKLSRFMPFRMNHSLLGQKKENIWLQQLKEASKRRKLFELRKPKRMLKALKVSD